MADMEADNMAREMTPQERAAAIAEQIVRALDVHPSPINIDAVLPWVKETRRAALLEVAELHQEWRNGKHSGTFSDLLRHKLAQEG